MGECGYTKHSQARADAMDGKEAKELPVRNGRRLSQSHSHLNPVLGSRFKNLKPITYHKQSSRHRIRFRIIRVIQTRHFFPNRMNFLRIMPYLETSESRNDADKSSFKKRDLWMIQITDFPPDLNQLSE